MAEDENSAQLKAYVIIDNAKYDIQRLPRFKGQTQIVAALRRVLDLSVWHK